MVAPHLVRKGALGLAAVLMFLVGFAQPAAAAADRRGVSADAEASCLSTTSADVSYTITNNGTHDLYVTKLRLYLATVSREGRQLVNWLDVYPIPEPIPVGGSMTWQFEMGGGSLAGQQLVLDTEAYYYKDLLAKNYFLFPACNG